MEQEKIIIRRAVSNDLPAIIAMLADDILGASREDASLPLAKEYKDAFQAIDNDPNQFLAVATQKSSIIGTLNLSFMPGLARKGMWRCQIEAVRVAEGHRGKGIGEIMFKWAIEMSKAKGCGLVQLTTDKARNDAHRFYDRFGFAATHEGYKLTL